MVLVHVTLIPLWGSRRKDGYEGRGGGIGPSIMLYFHLTVDYAGIVMYCTVRECTSFKQQNNSKKARLKKLFRRGILP